MLAFDKGTSFAFDKAAGAPCPHLANHDCTIHDTLKDRGFTGCIRYQCNGAGPRTLALFDGISWQDDPALLIPQMQSFQHLRHIHDLIELLLAAGSLALPPAVQSRRLALLSRLCPPDLNRQTAKTLATGPLGGEIRAFLKSLAGFATANPVSKK